MKRNTRVSAKKVDAFPSTGRPCALRRAFCTLLIGCSFLGLYAISFAPASASPDFRAPVKSLVEMRHHDVVIQHWDLSCGAAALSTLLKYQYRQPVTERDVALELLQRKEYIANPSRVTQQQGFSLLDLKRVADARGLQGIGLGNLDITALTARAPLIVPVTLHGYSHFVVFRGAFDGQVLLADPAWGNRTMSVEAFERAWINYPQIGRLGFVVARANGSIGPNRLAPRLRDFVLLR